MEAHLAPMQPIQMNNITSSCEIGNGPHDTQYCMKIPEQAFVNYASSRIDEVGGKWYTFKPKQNNTGDIYNPSWKSQQNLSDMMFIEIIKKNDDSQKEEPEVGENAVVGELKVEYFDVFPTRKNINRGIDNFTGRIKGMHVFVGNFTYVIDFMIVEDISSIIDPRLSQVVVGKPFVEISNMTHNPPEGVVRFTNGTDEISYKMPHKIE
nr:MAK10-like protein [Tanacetum cinerariifolium]